MRITRPSPRGTEWPPNGAAPGRAEFNRSAKTTSVLAAGLLPRGGLLARHEWQVSWLAGIGGDRGDPLRSPLIVPAGLPRLPGCIGEEVDDS